MENQRLKLYFAHPINTYSTQDEEKILRLLQAHPLLKKYAIENPNQPCHQEGYQKMKDGTGNGMPYFFELVKECSGTAMLPFADGSIGAGVAGEAEISFDKKDPVFYISIENFSIYQIPDFSGIKILSIDETRARLRDTEGNMKTEFYKMLKLI